MREIYTQRNKEKFFSDGYLYIFDKVSKKDSSLKFWRCERKDECKARLHTRDNVVIKELNQHSHSPCPSSMEVAVVRTNLKFQAQESQENPASILNSVTSEIPQAVQGTLPTSEAMKQTIRRMRNRTSCAPPNPRNAEELVLPIEYTQYSSFENPSENFLIADSGTDNSRILIFGRQSWTSFLVDSTVWFCDGTFKLSPLIFDQVYVVMAKRYNSVHPVLYALLPDKSRSTYIRMFEMIQSAIPGVNPTRISCDYEIAAIQAMRQCFPEVNIQGCFFHLAQNFQKQLKKRGLFTSYKNNAEFALKSKMILSLAYVPIPYLGMYLEYISGILPEDLQPVLDWFEDNYIGRPLRHSNQRRPPLFPAEMWNIYNRTVSNEDRTNNHAEAAHRKIYTELGVHHPTIWNFITSLRFRKEETRTTSS